MIEELSAILCEFPVGEISTAAEVTKHASKGWQHKKALPRAVPLINMARRSARVNKWLKAVIDSGEYEPDEPKLLSELHELLSRHARQ